MNTSIAADVFHAHLKVGSFGGVNQLDSVTPKNPNKLSNLGNAARINRIPYRAPLPSCVDEPDVAQRFQMKRYERLARANLVAEVAHAPLPEPQPLEDSKAGRIRQRREEWRRPEK